MKLRRLAYLAVCSAVPTSALSQSGPAADPFVKRTIPAVHTDQPIVVDGDLSDEAWTSAPRAEQFVDRQRSTLMEDQTTAMILYDDKYIYIAFDCKDSQPENITARETVRDSKYATQSDDPNREDNVTVSLDCFNSRDSSDQNVFSANALGTPSAQIAGGRGNKIEWQGLWDSAAKRTPTGYIVEMRIPWQMLNYPSSSDPIQMGINFFRFHNRLTQQSIWSNVGNQGFLENGGTWKDVRVPQQSFKPKVSLLPYILPGIDEDGDFRFRSGLDARFPITRELTAVGSLNPDFSTIEGAVEGIQFSRAERFVPERRPFFLEGSNYFNPYTRFNDIGLLFYSRRVRAFDLGTKLYGKLSPKDTVGILDTTTFDNNNVFVGRYAHDFGTNNRVGAFISNLTGPSVLENTVAQVDTHYRKGSVGFESQFLQSSGDLQTGTGVVLSANYQHGTNTSLLQYQSLSNNLNVPLGYVPYTGHNGFIGFTSYDGQWKSGYFRNYSFGLTAIRFDHFDAGPFWYGQQVYASLTTRNDWLMEFVNSYDEIDGTIDNPYSFRLMYGASNRFRQIGLQYQLGRLGSKPSHFVQPSASFRLFRKLDLAYAGSILDLGGVSRQDIYVVNYEFSPTRSIGGRVVVQDGLTNWYISYRNAGKAGTDFYVILGDPNALKFRRLFQIKVVFAI